MKTLDLTVVSLTAGSRQLQRPFSHRCRAEPAVYKAGRGARCESARPLDAVVQGRQRSGAGGAPDGAPDPVQNLPPGEQEHARGARDRHETIRGEMKATVIVLPRFLGYRSEAIERSGFRGIWCSVFSFHVFSLWCGRNSATYRASCPTWSLYGLFPSTLALTCSSLTSFEDPSNFRRRFFEAAKFVCDESRIEVASDTGRMVGPPEPPDTIRISYLKAGKWVSISFRGSPCEPPIQFRECRMHVSNCVFELMTIPLLLQEMGPVTGTRGV